MRHARGKGRIVNCRLCATHLAAASRECCARLQVAYRRDATCKPQNYSGRRLRLGLGVASNHVKRDLSGGGVSEPPFMAVWREKMY